jgi:hypothetical protein
MWTRIITKNAVEDVPALIEAVKKEEPFWEVADGIKSEASLELPKEKNLSVFDRVDVLSTPDGLDFCIKLSGVSRAVRCLDFEFSGAAIQIFEHFLPNIPYNSRFTSNFRFKRRGASEEFLILAFNPSVNGRAKMIINVVSLEDAPCTKEEFIEISKTAGDFEVETNTPEKLRLVGDFLTTDAFRVATKLINVIRDPEISGWMTVSTAFDLVRHNKNEVSKWISFLKDYDFKMPFKWNVVINLREGQPLLGHENDGLLALCEKLIYIGSYEGEGEVHVSLLEKRGGARHLALDSKYPLLKSQIPKSLRHLEWKRG